MKDYIKKTINLFKSQLMTNLWFVFLIFSLIVGNCMLVLLAVFHVLSWDFGAFIQNGEKFIVLPINVLNFVFVPVHKLVVIFSGLLVAIIVPFIPTLLVSFFLTFGLNGLNRFALKCYFKSWAIRKLKEISLKKTWKIKLFFMFSGIFFLPLFPLEVDLVKFLVFDIVFSLFGLISIFFPIELLTDFLLEILNVSDYKKEKPDFSMLKKNLANSVEDVGEVEVAPQNKTSELNPAEKTNDSFLYKYRYAVAGAVIVVTLIVAGTLYYYGFFTATPNIDLNNVAGAVVSSTTAPAATVTVPILDASRLSPSECELVVQGIKQNLAERPQDKIVLESTMKSIIRQGSLDSGIALSNHFTFDASAYTNELEAAEECSMASCDYAVGVTTFAGDFIPEGKNCSYSNFRLACNLVEHNLQTNTMLYEKTCEVWTKLPTIPISEHPSYLEETLKSFTVQRRYDLASRLFSETEQTYKGHPTANQANQILRNHTKTVEPVFVDYFNTILVNIAKQFRQG